MVILARTANIQDGKAGPAFEWAVKVAHHLNGKIEGLDLRVLRNISGPVYQVHWIGTYASLAEYEALMKKVVADAGYQEMLGQARQEGLYFSESIHDQLYETIG